MTAQKQVEESLGEAMTFDLTELGSEGILRVLDTITKNTSINITHLARKTKIQHSSCNYHVKKLIEMGLLEERRYGNIKMIRPTFNSLTIELKKGFGLKIIRM
jgi:DNA-binding transcriptional ArsR family regulator